MFCSNCGKENSAQARFCEKCGAALPDVRTKEDTVLEGAADVQSKLSGIKIALIVICVVITVTLLLACVIIQTKKEDKKDYAKETENTTETTKEKKEDTAWKKVYYDFLTDCVAGNISACQSFMDAQAYENVADFVKSGDAKEFVLLYVNDDDIPELALYLPCGLMAYFTCVDDKLQGIPLDGELWWPGEYDDIVCVEKENIIIRDYSEGCISFYTRVYKVTEDMQGEEVKRIYRGERDWEGEENIYQIDDKDVSVEELEAAREEYASKWTIYSYGDGSMYQLNEETIQKVLNYTPEYEPETEENQTDVVDWKRLYREFLYQKTAYFTQVASDLEDEESQEDVFYVEEYGVVYIDNDDVPELIVHYGSQQPYIWEERIYTVRDGTVQEISGLTDKAWRALYSFKEKTGEFCRDDGTSLLSQFAWHTIYQYDNGEASIIYQLQSPDDENMEGWSINDDEVSQEEYIKILKKYISDSKCYQALDYFSSPDFSEITEENVHKTFGTGEGEAVAADIATTRKEKNLKDGTQFANIGTDAEELTEGDFQSYLDAYCENYTYMVTEKNFGYMQDYLYYGEEPDEGYDCVTEMHRMLGYSSILDMKLLSDTVDKLEYVDDNTIRMHTTEAYYANYKLSYKQIKNNKDLYKQCKKDLKGSNKEKLYKVEANVNQTVYYELKLDGTQWKFYTYVEGVNQTTDVLSVEQLD